MATPHKIPFNRPYIAGKELEHIAQAVELGNIGNDGEFTQKCSRFLEQTFAIPKVLLTSSCTAALEMAAQLCDLRPGDEVIVPSFTFVSTVSAFVHFGAQAAFVDIRPDTLNLDERLIEAAITPRTRAIVPVHYAGVGCEMDHILEIADAHKLLVVEDAAQGVNAFYKGRALGSIGHLGTYSFHETKNYICGEGGALCINSLDLLPQAEIIRDKGTNRQAFNRGEVESYTWVDFGSSYVPSEIVSAFLYGQLELLDTIAERRREIFEFYREQLAGLEAEGRLRLPRVPAHCTGNHHMFYILLRDGQTRDALLEHLRDQGIQAVFHYVPLHSSPMGQRLSHQSPQLPVTDDVSARLLRLPFFYSITRDEQREVVRQIQTFLMDTPARIAGDLLFPGDG
jgi:dTDP-4-amino-4,6-dideoxygalactose transaminase